jgi:GAF domain-containing protein
MLGRSELLVAQIEHALSQLFPGAQSQMLLHSAGIWRRWASPDEVDDVARLVVPAEMQHWTTPRVFAAGRLYVPLTPGAVGVLVEQASGVLEPSDALEVLRQYATLAMQTCERQRLARQGLEEVQAVQRVAERILKSHDLNEILLHITMEAKRLLSSDICGVLLREGDEIVMRRCVGNMSPETAGLRMGPGQGLAGLVLARRAPSSVDDYVSSGTISRDFFHLAEAEAVRSALAAPLLGREQTIGVLEVWRRRASTFTDADNSRLVALANLASIAIENAELYASQKQSVEQLAQANLALNQRYDTVEGLSKLTQDLMQLLLDGGGLNAIVAGASNYLGAAVVLVDLDGTLLAHAGQGRPEGEMLDELQAWLARNTGTREPQALALQSMNWRAHPMSVGNETVAWVLGEVGPGARAGAGGDRRRPASSGAARSESRALRDH